MHIFSENQNKNKGIAKASFLGPIAAVPTSIATIGIRAGMRKASELSYKDSIQLRKAVQEGLKQSGLYEKGVRVYRVKEVKPKNIFNTFSPLLKKLDIEKIKKQFENNFSKKDNKALKTIQKELSRGIQYGNGLTEAESNVLHKINEKSAAINVIPYKLGLNASYRPYTNKIIAPEKSFQTAVFHEMGHAMIENGNKILKEFFNKSDFPCKKLPGIILAVSILNKRKTTDEKSDNKIQNAFDWIKKHAAALTIASMTPILAEEGLASLKGQGIAKNLVKQGKLSKNTFNKVKLNNFLGLISYALEIAGAVAVCKYSIKLKDETQAKYEEKQLNKNLN